MTNLDGNYLGIDFSGNHLMWRPRVAHPNVWVAKVSTDGERRTLQSVFPVHELDNGSATALPFLLLASFLHAEKFKGAGIDAPFSVPFEFWPSDGHGTLWESVATMSRPQGRQFPRAHDFAETIRRGRSEPKKPLRATEEYWNRRKINVRSTLWSGPRGGAAMTAACLATP